MKTKTITNPATLGCTKQSSNIPAKQNAFIVIISWKLQQSLCERLDVRP